MPTVHTEMSRVYTADSGPFTQSVTWTKAAGPPTGLGMDRTGGRWKSARAGPDPPNVEPISCVSLLHVRTQMEDKTACP